MLFLGYFKINSYLCNRKQIKIMIELKIKITRIDKHVDGSKNPFYGAQERKMSFEIVNQREFDKREDIAPCGVHLALSFSTSLDHAYSSEKEKVESSLDIKVNRYAFEKSGDYFVVSFDFGTKVYELDVWFEKDENGKFLSKIENVILEEWLSNDAYEYAETSNNLYSKDSFKLIKPTKC